VNVQPGTYLQGKDAPVRWAIIAWLKNNILAEKRSVTFLDNFEQASVAPNYGTLTEGEGSVQFTSSLT
jgi:hypothetical protein